MIRFVHPRVAALVSVFVVVLTGNVANGEGIMSKNINRSRPAVPPVHTTRSGSRYVRSIDVIRSVAGRRELNRQLQNVPKNGTANKETKAEDKSKT